MIGSPGARPDTFIGHTDVSFYTGVGSLENLRKYGKAPFDVAVIHGGPGAAGEMAPVARELSRVRGILEPLQTASTIDEQVRELRALLEAHGDVPATLIGHSWGAWLSLIVAARYPSLVKKLILVASGPLEEKYLSQIIRTRMGRLSANERSVALAFMDGRDMGAADKDTAFAKFGDLMAKADSFDPLPRPPGACHIDNAIFQGVWSEAEKMRRSGELLALAEQVRCPVVAIHGDYDPHPFEGVEKPLRRVVKDFRSVLLQDCGHEPWMERNARDRFFEVLKEELD